MFFFLFIYILKNYFPLLLNFHIYIFYVVVSLIAFTSRFLLSTQTFFFIFFFWGFLIFGAFSQVQYTTLSLTNELLFIFNILLFVLVLFSAKSVKWF